MTVRCSPNLGGEDADFAMGVLALAAGLGVIWVAVRRALPRPELVSPGVELPTTMLQRWSRWSLGIGLVLAVSAAAVVLNYGVETTHETDNIRVIFTLLLLGVVVVLGGASIWLKQQPVGIHGCWMSEIRRSWSARLQCKVRRCC